jgi:hypothetical protein
VATIAQPPQQAGNQQQEWRLRTPRELNRLYMDNNTFYETPQMRDYTDDNVYLIVLKTTSVSFPEFGPFLSGLRERLHQRQGDLPPSRRGIIYATKTDAYSYVVANLDVQTLEKLTTKTKHKVCWPQSVYCNLRLHVSELY